MSEKEAAALEALDKLNIPYVRLSHPACASMEECACIVSPSGAKHCKNLFLTNKRGTEFYLLLLDHQKRFVTSRVSKLIGSTRLSFAGDDKLAEMLGLSPGSISVTGLINDMQRRVQPVIDADILKTEKMLIHPSVNTASLEVCTADVTAFIKALGYEPRIIEIDDRQ